MFECLNLSNNVIKCVIKEGKKSLSVNLLQKTGYKNNKMHLKTIKTTQKLQLKCKM